jgi:hypothetical protein
MPSFRWLLHDPFIGDNYTFDMNPNADSSPQLKKTLAFVATAAPDGALIIAEGRDQPMQMQLTGTLLTQTQYTTLSSWFTRRHPIVLTDDLGRQLTIYITGFSPKRKVSRNFPWRHDYTVDCYVFSVA